MNHRHPDADINDVVPTAKQEREAMTQEFAQNAIAPLELAESVLVDCREYLWKCPGHNDVAQYVSEALDRIEQAQWEVKP